MERKGRDGVDAYGHLSPKIIGADFRGNEPENDFDSESVWDFMPLTLAVYGSAGRDQDFPSTAPENIFHRLGADADADLCRTSSCCSTSTRRSPGRTTRSCCSTSRLGAEQK